MTSDAFGQSESASSAVTDDSSTPQSPPFDCQKWVHDMKREDAHRAHDNLTQFYNSINEQSIKSAELTLRTCILINGGAAVVFSLPAYSPDLNPIEQAFAKMKTLLRKADARTIEQTWRTLGALLDCFTSTECANYFRNAGYASA